ncbi:MAG: hypothetical protein WC506_04860 [Candidatus Micrarchaeia archaeon]
MSKMAKANEKSTVSSPYPANHYFYARHFSGPITKEAFEGKVVSMLKSEWEGFSGPYGDVIAKGKIFVADLEKKGSPKYSAALMESASVLGQSISGLNGKIIAAKESAQSGDDELLSFCVSSMLANAVNSLTPIGSAVDLVQHRNEQQYRDLAKGSIRPLEKFQAFMENPVDITITFDGGRATFLYFNYPRD